MTFVSVSRMCSLVTCCWACYILHVQCLCPVYWKDLGRTWSSLPSWLPAYLEAIGVHQ